MKTFSLLVSLGLLLCTDISYADRIFLKSGEVKEGKLKKMEAVFPMDTWCVGKDEIAVWGELSAECILESNIERVEKVFRKPEGVGLLAKDDQWGKESGGFRTQLIPAGPKYIVGQPMLFHLVMQNVGDDIAWYDDQGLAHPSFKIMAPDGKQISHIVGPFQTSGVEEHIDTGEIVNLMENRDITNEYIIIEPGKYSIQFVAGWSDSNVIEFEVQPGQPKKEDVLLLSLSASIPGECVLHRGWQSVPYGRQGDEAGSLAIFCRKMHEMSGETFLWQTDVTADVNNQAASERTSEYIGKNDAGYVYFSPSETLVKLWPTIKEDTIKALKLSQ